MLQPTERSLGIAPVAGKLAEPGCWQLIATCPLLYKRHLGIAQHTAELSWSSLAVGKGCEASFS